MRPEFRFLRDFLPDRFQISARSFLFSFQRPTVKMREVTGGVLLRNVFVWSDCTIGGKYIKSAS